MRSDQMPQNAVSDLGLHCLQLPFWCFPTKMGQLLIELDLKFQQVPDESYSRE